MNAKWISLGTALVLAAATNAPAALQRIAAPTDAVRPVSLHDLQTQLDQARQELVQLLTKFDEQSPKVVAQVQKIALLQQLLEAKQSEQDAQQKARESATT